MNVQQFIKRNASTILTGIGAAGVVVTAVLAVKQTPKAMSLLDDAMEEKGESLTKWEKVKVAGPVYVPAIVAGVGTMACIFGSNILSKHQQATLASAYALLDNSYREYKKKADELYGEEAGQQIRSEIAKDKYTGDDLLLDDTEELFFDFYSGRYFNSTKDKVAMAFYEINRKLALDYYVSVNELYDILGLEEMPEYENIGWSVGSMTEMYWHSWIEFQLEDVVIEEESDYSGGIECTIVHMPMEPFMDYNAEW